MKLLFFFSKPKGSNDNSMSSLRENHCCPNDFHVGLHSDCALSDTELKKGNTSAE